MSQKIVNGNFKGLGNKHSKEAVKEEVSLEMKISALKQKYQSGKKNSDLPRAKTQRLPPPTCITPQPQQRRQEAFQNYLESINKKSDDQTPTRKSLVKLNKSKHDFSLTNDASAGILQQANQVNEMFKDLLNSTPIKGSLVEPAR